MLVGMGGVQLLSLFPSLLLILPLFLFLFLFLVLFLGYQYVQLVGMGLVQMQGEGELVKYAQKWLENLRWFVHPHLCTLTEKDKV